MKLNKIIFFAILATSLLTSCDKYNEERQKAAGEKFKGNVEETVGNITNDKELKQKSEKNKLKGDLRSSKEDIKDIVTDK